MKALARLTLLLTGLAGALLLQGRPAFADRLIIACNLQPASVTVGAQLPFDCTVTDQFGSLVPDASLSFFVALDPSGQATVAGLGVKATVVTTDATGHAKAAFQMGMKPGTVGLEVTFTGTKGVYTVLQVQEAPAPPAPLPPAPSPPEE